MTAAPKWRLVPMMRPSLSGLGGTIVTRLLSNADGLLWVSCYDGTVRAYDVSGYGDGRPDAAAATVIDDDDDDDDVGRSRPPPWEPLFRSDFAGKSFPPNPPSSSGHP
jgi:hypothetical protein